MTTLATIILVVGLSVFILALRDLRRATRL